MTGVSIVEEGHGAAHFQARLRALEHNLEQVPLAAAETMKALETYNADSWAKFSAPDTESTDERWPGHQPLDNTGALRDSLTKSDAPGAVREIDKAGFTFGTDVPYAPFLQRGTKKMRPHIVMNLRAMRAVAGAAMRKILLRGVLKESK